MRHANRVRPGPAARRHRVATGLIEGKTLAAIAREEGVSRTSDPRLEPIYESGYTAKWQGNVEPRVG